MNHILEYLLIGLAVVLGTSFMTDYAVKNMGLEFSSYHDIIEDEKNKTGELLKIIDVFDSPLRIDVINIGLNDIQIKKMFGSGTEYSYTIDGQNINIIPLNQIVTIQPQNDSEEILIITTNNKKFVLRN